MHLDFKIHPAANTVYFTIHTYGSGGGLDIVVRNQLRVVSCLFANIGVIARRDVIPSSSNWGVTAGNFGFAPPLFLSRGNSVAQR